MTKRKDAGDRLREEAEAAKRNGVGDEPERLPRGEWKNYRKTPDPSEAGGKCGGKGGEAAEAPPVAGPRKLAKTRLSDVKVRPVEWLVPGLVPLGKLTMIAGDGGHGKSATTLDLIAALTNGRPAFGLDYVASGPARCLLISCEDDLADTVVPRLMAAGADLAFVEHVEGLQDGEGKVSSFTLAHCRELEADIAANPDVRLVVIDPAGAYIGRAVDDHKDSELRAVLSPLAELAARHNVAIIIVKHLNKGTNIKAVARVGGSVGYVNAVRSALLVAPDPEDESRKFLLPMKSNLARPRGLSYRLQDLTREELDKLAPLLKHLSGEHRAELEGQLFRVRWLGAVSITADDALAKPDQKQGGADVTKAADWLRVFLGEGPRPSLECVKQGNTALSTSHSLDWWNKKILKGQLNGKPRKVGFANGWDWELPNSSHTSSTPSTPCTSSTPSPSSATLPFPGVTASQKHGQTHEGVEGVEDGEGVPEWVREAEAGETGE